MDKKIFLLLIVVVCILVSCRNTNKSDKQVLLSGKLTDTTAGILVAENIIQDIVIKNNDPDNAWAEECLQGMRRDSLVNAVFEMAYMQKATTYDFDTNEKLTVKQLKQIEMKEGFSRDKIGKIQFIENWYLDPATVTMTKKVSSIVLGYETYDSMGEFRGYLPVFRMVLN